MSAALKRFDVSRKADRIKREKRSAAMAQSLETLCNQPFISHIKNVHIVARFLF